MKKPNNAIDNTPESAEQSNDSERCIYSPIYTAGHEDMDIGQAGFYKIFEAAAIAVTAQYDTAGRIHLQTDDAGRAIAANHIQQAAQAVTQWINITSLLMAECPDDVSEGIRYNAGWAIVGMSELLMELQRALGELSLQTMSPEAVKNTIAARQKREANP